MSSCNNCGKQFVRKNGLQKHTERKTPCKPLIISDFRANSIEFNKSLTKQERLDQGIFFSPKKARLLLFSILEYHGITPHSILEPSFGSGEFILDAQLLYPNTLIYGIEKNNELFQSLHTTDPNIQLTCCDFMDWTGVVDLIIGNPPYFVIKDKSYFQKYPKMMTARPNIYILFLYKCIEEHLTPGGILAFIIPTSIYNCSYYQSMRNYIKQYTQILHVETLNKPGFYETGQETCLLVLRKNNIEYSLDDEKSIYLFEANEKVYISPFYKELYQIIQNTTTISHLGLSVKTGSIVWNYVKPHLSDTGTLLIYSSNINNSVLTLDNLSEPKKQYLTDINKPTINEPVILVERGYGNTIHFDFVLVDGSNYGGIYAENHINVIYATSPQYIPNLYKVLESFKDPRTKQFIKWCIGNGSLSSTDMEYLLPIF